MQNAAAFFSMRCKHLIFLAVLALAAPAFAAPKRVLFFTRSDGFRHDSIQVARQVLPSLAPTQLEFTLSEDIALLSAASLRNFDAVFFFTSGELPLTSQQKQDLLQFIRQGGGFAGAHSATDTLYTWPEYGELIGGIFDGHPWVQEARIDVEDPTHPATAGLNNNFTMLEEYYQFRAFSRERTRVLLALDVTSINLQMPGVNRTDRDFALAWAHTVGQGRVFYTALGHFDQTWRDARFQRMLQGGLLWITGQVPGEAAPRGAATAAPPTLAAVADAAQGGFPNRAAPGAIVSIYGERLTSGSTMAGDGKLQRLAGTRVRVGEQDLPLYFASPTQLNVVLPTTLPTQGSLPIRVVSGVNTSQELTLQTQPATPGIFAVTRITDAATIWCTGLGVLPNTSLRVEVDDRTVPILFAGPSPEFPGLQQINVALPGNTPPQRVRLQVGDATAGWPPR